MARVDEIMRGVMEALTTVERQLMEALKENKGRGRGELARQIHEVRQMLAPVKYPFPSQAGQDMIVDRVLNKKRGGVFVDVGGYDGLTGSNTMFFEKWRDWTGILVEPVQSTREMAAAIRKVPCLPFAVAATDGEAEFIEVTKGYTQMSGLLDSYDPNLLARVRGDPRHEEATVRVETRTLSRILTDNNVPHPDFLSLDIEGGEIAVLEQFPFDQHDVKVWSIENNDGSDRLGEIMSRAGYAFVDFAGPDELWRKRDL